MKTNELRIGNLVTIFNEKHWDKLKDMPLKITAINQLQDFEGSKNGVSLEHLTQLPNTYYETYSIFLHFIKPIQINEAWLKSFGFSFNETHKYWWLNNNITHDIELQICNDGIYPTYTEEAEFSNQMEQRVSLNRINYIHELQNLSYALTGVGLSLSSI